MSFNPRKMLGIASLFTAAAVTVVMLPSPSATAADQDSRRNARSVDDPRIDRGFNIAPVPLNMRGKDPDLVGLGSYLVNVYDCNGCHSAGPATEFAAGGNPYFGQKTAFNLSTYLGGGRDFGAYPAEGPFPHIISRNLTPGKSGLPAGDLTFGDFRNIIRTGMDHDNAHPTCTGAPNGTCLPAPFDGSLLQIMPWPLFQNMTEKELRAIYEYLSAIPCLEGGPRQEPGRCQ